MTMETQHKDSLNESYIRSLEDDVILKMCLPSVLCKGVSINEAPVQWQSGAFSTMITLLASLNLFHSVLSSPGKPIFRQGLDKIKPILASARFPNSSFLPVAARPLILK